MIRLLVMLLALSELLSTKIDVMFKSTNNYQIITPAEAVVKIIEFKPVVVVVGGLVGKVAPSGNVINGNGVIISLLGNNCIGKKIGCVETDTMKALITV